MVVVGVGACLVLGAGCSTPPRPKLSGDADRQGLVRPFAPQSLRIHPLTHVDRTARGELEILCYIELRDAWQDTCKATGKLSIQLYQPVGGRASGRGALAQHWEIDLSDLDRNRDLFDQATRTYRLPLSEAPAWLEGRGENELPVARLRAVLITTGPRGEERVLQDEVPLEG
jgi:hypothetical protein